MLKEFMQYLSSKEAKPIEKTDANGDQRIYYDGNTQHIKPFGLDDGSLIPVNTLDGLVAILNNGVNKEWGWGRNIVQISSNRLVKLIDEADNRGTSRLFATAEPIISEFSMGHWYQSEEFIINLLANFVETPDLKPLIAAISNVNIEEGVKLSDDGITQKVTAKKGIRMEENINLPDRVRLAPIRTFVEIDQPVSEFVFRVRQSGGGIACALFEADGGFWKIDAKENIARYLCDNINDEILKDTVIIL